MMCGLRSTKWMGNGLFVFRCFTFQMLVTSWPSSFSACLMSLTSVEGWIFLGTTLKLLVLSGFIGVEFGVFIHKGFNDCCIDRTFCWLDFHLVIR